MIYNISLLMAGLIFLSIGIWGNYATIIDHSFMAPYGGMPNPMSIALVYFGAMFILAGVLHIRNDLKIAIERPKLEKVE